VRPLPPGEAGSIAAHLGLDARARRRLWLGARGTVTLAPGAAGAGGGDVLLDLGPITMHSAGVVALKARVLAWDEDKDAGGGFPYDFTQVGAVLTVCSQCTPVHKLNPLDLTRRLKAPGFNP
jgi:hypothetical protein